MCGLCGALGGERHWTAAPGLGAATHRAERMRQVGLANRVLAPYRLKLDDWQGTSFVLSGPTGAREIVDTLPAVFAAARRMTGKAIDPLDRDFLARLAVG